ncbi:unnamed protein product [Pieris macdunnoughi]|uniref:Uncharacterized protein n=1 Tax=Pieris macdunnoughi TaxID=345717 RepID=A0A821T3K0_9NEOP|nr:unnamed protein product [Pieris macdunnoughi]
MKFLKPILIINTYFTFYVKGIELHTKSIEELEVDYEDEKNSMIAITESDEYISEDFYDELDNRLRVENSMDMIFFGPPNSFLRLDSETILHIFAHTKKQLIPISRALLAWDIITDGKTTAFLQGREYLAFGSLLNVVPEEDLYYVNFGDPSVFKYFSKNDLKISSRKIGVLVAAYRRYYGNMWYRNGSHINELGYMLCGFPDFDLAKISPITFKELTVDVLGKLHRCSVKQTKTLYRIATHPDAYGEPYKWSSHELGRLNALFICIPRQEISAIQLEAMTAITPSVIKLMNQKKLEYFTKQQILRMTPKTRRILILRMQLKNSLDTSKITKKSCGVLNFSIALLSWSFIVSFLLCS